MTERTDPASSAALRGAPARCFMHKFAFKVFVDKQRTHRDLEKTDDERQRHKTMTEPTKLITSVFESSATVAVAKTERTRNRHRTQFNNVDVVVDSIKNEKKTTR